MVQLGVIIKSEINSLAHLLSGLEGFEAADDYDFSISKSPRARDMWNRAIMVWGHVNNDKDILRHRIKL